MDSGFTLAFPDKFAPKDRTFPVNYSCQRCCQPLKLHSSFRDLDQQTLAELSVPLYHNNDRADRHYLIDNFSSEFVDSSIHRKIVLPVKFGDATSDFMVVDELLNLPLDDDQTLRVTSALFDIMSDQSGVDHPLCEECTDNLLDQMDQQLRTAEDECKEYKDFLENLQVDNNEGCLERLTAELAELQKMEAQLQEELCSIEEQDRETKRQLRSLQDEYEMLEREEDKQWKEYCRMQRQYLLSEDSNRSVNNQLQYAQAQFDRLIKTNIFNATFHIWHSGHFGTINNYRLGRLPNVHVEWSEINAAWGQTVLLLHSLARKMDFTFNRYRLVPYGNHSYIEDLEKSKDLPIYGAGGLFFIMNAKFDEGMASFLDCLIQFKNHVEKMDKSFHLPYRMMEKGKLEDSSSKVYSIKTHLNSEDGWTKALKYMLTNLKWALAWVSSQFQPTDP